MAPLPVKRNLKVLPLAGDGEMNDLERGIMAPLVVQVRDQNDRPVEGADVVFRFPPSGPGAFFADRKYSQKVRTNDQGQAAAVGWAANSLVGSFKVYITVTYGDQMGETSVSMTNVSRVTEAMVKKKSRWSSGWFKAAVIVGAAGIAAAIVLATRGGGGSPNVTISTGSPTIGGPH
jgi:hypothetical protein